MPDSSASAWSAWRSARLAQLVAPTGNLALVETRWLPAGETPDPDRARREAPETVVVTTLERESLETGETEHGLRFWDAGSDAIRRFDTVDAYPFDPEWVVPARYEPAPDGHTVAFEHIRDNGGTRDKAVPGTIRATIGGEQYALSAFDDDGRLLLVFGDATNREETYGAGRFLFVDRAEGEAEVVLDFNRAFVPPCGFSDQFNCPMPPPQNRLRVAVTAGEKKPRFRD